MAAAHRLRHCPDSLYSLYRSSSRYLGPALFLPSALWNRLPRIFWQPGSFRAAGR